MLVMTKTLPLRGGQDLVAAGTTRHYYAPDGEHPHKADIRAQGAEIHMFTARIKAGARTGAAVAGCALAGLLALTGCGSSGGSAAAPSWAKGLGPSVTVVAPGPVSPGNDTPGDVMAGVVGSITKGPITEFCKYEQPKLQSQCNSTFSQVTPAMVASQLPSFKNFGMGWVAIDGAKALIGVTGTVCVPNQNPKCFTNTDPEAIFKTAKPFATLWSQAIAAPPNVYSLSPAVKIDGKWYAYTSTA